MIKLNALKKLDNETLGKILDAQIDELVERRAVQDGPLFRYAFFNADPTTNAGGPIPDADAPLDSVADFSAVAGAAFVRYHNPRRQGAHLDDAGGLVLDHPDVDAATPDAQQPAATDPDSADAAADS